MSETLQTIDGRSMLRIERRLAHPREKVWRAITEPAHLAQWFPSNVEMDLRPGGVVRFVFPDGEGPESEGVVAELDPPRVLAYTWLDNVLRYELQLEDDGCRLIFTHTFDDRAGAASFASGWHVCFDGLAMVLAGRPVETDHPPTLHESYVRKFGLDEGSCEDTAHGWRVRFERQLTRPAEEVWATLSAAGPDTPVVGGPVPPGFATAEVPAGVITAVNAPTLLEYEWLAGDVPGARESAGELAGGEPGGRVRWELGAGTGHGARLFVTQTGPPAQGGARSTALTAWRDHIEWLAERLLSTSDRSR